MAGANTTDRTPTFSPREHEVLDLIVRGHTNGEIAETLGISFATAKWHVSELIGKVGVDSREEVADYWRHERAPRRRLTRALRGLIAGPALKLAGGGAIAGIAATGAVWVAVVANGSGGPRTAQVVDLTPTATSPATQPAVTLGQPAPQFSLPYARDPSRFVQLDDFLGRPLVLTWYASWCDACSDILRDLDELRGAYPQLAVLAISLEEPAATATAYLDGIPTLIDAALDERREVAWRYGVTGLPSTVLIDGSGVVQYLALGTAPTETLFGHFLRATGLVEPAVEAPRPDVCRETGSGPTREEAQAALLCHALNWPAIAAADAGNCDLRSLDLAPTGDEFGHLDHIDFRGCVLDGARLDRHTMNAASFAGVSAAGARMAFVQLNNGDLSGADLSHSDLVRAGLQWTNFTNANLLGADLTNAITRGATWNNTICPDGTNSDANGGTCVGTISVSDYWPASGPGGWVAPPCSTNGQPPAAGVFCAAGLYDGIAVESDGTCHAPFYSPPTTDLRWADLRKCNLAGATFEAADFERASLAGADLEGALLLGASIFLADLTAANLRGAVLDGAVISHTTLEGADLTGASTIGALMRGTYKNTTCPDGTNSDTDDGDGLTCASNLLP